MVLTKEHCAAGKETLDLAGSNSSLSHSSSPYAQMKYELHVLFWNMSEDVIIMNCQ